MLLEASRSGEAIRVDELWRRIVAVVPRAELQAAVTTVSEIVPHVDDDDEGDMRARLAARTRLVGAFARQLTEVIEFGANAEGASALEAMKRMPELLASRRKLQAADVDGRLVRGSWRRLVYGPDGAVDKNAYALCVLTQFHRHLKRRDIYAPGSSRWRDPRAQLLAGEAWQSAKYPVLRALSLAEDPTALLAAHAHAPWTGPTAKSQPA
jgi:hypothetical protein